MQNDTRDRNKYFDKTSLELYFKDYSRSITRALDTVSILHMKQAYDHLHILRGTTNRLFVGGNGGSASISDHLNCDFTKGIYRGKAHPPHVVSLCGSHSLHSAIANDMGYEHTLSHQLEMMSLTSNDKVILISSSGNSPNIIEAAKFARYKRSCLIGLTGFNGGLLNEMADIRLHVNTDNYGVVEDCHQILMHMLAQFIYLNENLNEHTV